MFLEELESVRMVYGDENVILEEKSDPNSQMLTVKVQVLSPTELDDAQEKRNHKSKGLWIAFVADASPGACIVLVQAGLFTFGALIAKR